MQTKHARTRIQQRGIPRIVVDLLVEFGEESPAPGGATRLMFSKRARRHLKRYARDVYGALQPHLGVYAIARDGRLLTVAHCNKATRRSR